MANMWQRKNGKWVVQYLAADGNRGTITLGRSEKSAKSICNRVTELEVSKAAGTTLDLDTADWLAKISDHLADRLARDGLIEGRASAKLGAFIDEYIRNRTDAKPGTVRNWKISRDKLTSFFGEEREMRTILAGEADDYRQHLVNAGYSEATVCKRIKHARQFFKTAERKEVIRRNPFADVPTGSFVNASRLHFVDRKTIERVIDAATDAEFRLIIALARYGGVRTPSETLGLTWGDIDWKGMRMTVPSPKTARSGKPYRVVPLFPELVPYLREAYDAAPTGSKHLIERYRDTAVNLRTRMLKTILRAKVEPWPRLFQNLRASREIELVEVFPAHVAAAWIGNSPAVADKHYLRTTEEHFQRATGGRRKSAANALQETPERGAAQALSSGKVIGGQESRTSRNRKGGNGLYDELRSNPKSFEDKDLGKVTPTGIEPVLPA